jgi:hypothetical protein
MGVTLGWVAFALAALGIAPHSDREKPPITYTVRMIEADGVGWREAVFASLTPVTRQGSATVWTLPLGASSRLLDEVTKRTPSRPVSASKVTAQSGAHATIQCRSNRPLVMQAAWTNEESPSPTIPENIRVGWHTTMVGRKLDQGILVQLVFEDTVVRAVHHVNVHCSAASNGACVASAAACAPQAVAGGGRATGLLGIAQGALKDAGVDVVCSGSQTCCEGADEKTKDDAVATASFDVPEFDNREVLGEWLIPRGSALLVSFGAFTVADNDGRAIVKERLALIEAVDASSAGPAAFVPTVEVPTVRTPIPPPALLSSQLVPKIREVPKMTLQTPVMPSRSMPQGVHADGTPADLPPLPSLIDEDAPSDSESAEPMPSPQMKTPKEPKTKPTTDTNTSKAEFSLPKAATMFLPSLFMPTPSVGFQFLLPIKPLSFKIPFGQRIEIEVFGRIVPDQETR